MVSLSFILDAKLNLTSCVRTAQPSEGRAAPEERSAFICDTNAACGPIQLASRGPSRTRSSYYDSRGLAGAGLGFGLGGCCRCRMGNGIGEENHTQGMVVLCS